MNYLVKAQSWMLSISAFCDRFTLAFSASLGCLKSSLDADKISSGETLPPNIIKAIAPYATAIQSMMSNPQLFGKFKALMKQAEAGQNQQ